MYPVNTPSRTNYNNVGTRNNGFLYKILPLSFNLQQRGNTTHLNKTCRTQLKIGDIVSGISADNKEYIGDVLNISYNYKTNKPEYITILSRKTHKPVKLLYKTVFLKQLKESKIYNFDKALYHILNNSDKYKNKTI